MLRFAGASKLPKAAKAKIQEDPGAAMQVGRRILERGDDGMDGVVIKNVEYSNQGLSFSIVDNVRPHCGSFFVHRMHSSH